MTPGGAVVGPGIGTPGSGITSRSFTDTYPNFVIVDTSQVATQGGWLTKIDYYAQQTGTIRFLLLDPSGVVQWESDPVSVTSVGAASDTLSTPAKLQAGWQLGYYTVGTGVIPFDCASSTVATVEWNSDNAGLPAVGTPLTPVAPSTGCPFGNGRTYSMGADILASKDQCKDGGWASWGVFKNQGDCVSFVATDGKNPPG